MRLVVVGATGAVGTEILRILEERPLDITELVPVASARSAGRKLTFRGDEVEVVELAETVFEDGDVALFDVPDEISLEWADTAVGRGAVVVDNSAAFRMDPEVPLVVPEVNPAAVEDLPKGIIASPNCTMLAMILPLAAFHRVAGLTEVVMSSYQAASGAGRAGQDELMDQLRTVVKDPERAVTGLGRDLMEAGEAFAHPLALNVIPQIGSVRDNGYTGEEVKVGDEIRKVLGLAELPVAATCVRVPTMVGHGVSVHARFERPIDVAEARRVLGETAGVVLMDDTAAAAYPTPLEAAGRDPVYVGRIRTSLGGGNALDFFAVGDNLRKGAALNTIQIAELLQT